MRDKFMKHKAKVRVFFALTLFTIGLYIITDFAQVYSVVHYQNTREVWERDFQKQLEEQRSELKFDFYDKYSSLRNQLTSYQLQNDARVKSLEEDLKELEDRLNEMNLDSEN